MDFEGDLTQDFLCYCFGGLIFGGAYRIHGRAYFQNFTVTYKYIGEPPPWGAVVIMASLPEQHTSGVGYVDHREKCLYTVVNFRHSYASHTRGGRNRIGRREKWPKKSWEEGEIGGKSREEGEKET